MRLLPKPTGDALDDFFYVVIRAGMWAVYPVEAVLILQGRLTLHNFLLLIAFIPCWGISIFVIQILIELAIYAIEKIRK